MALLTSVLGLSVCVPKAPLNRSSTQERLQTLKFMVSWATSKNTCGLKRVGERRGATKEEREGSGEEAVKS